MGFYRLPIQHPGELRAVIPGYAAQREEAGERGETAVPRRFGGASHDRAVVSWLFSRRPPAGQPRYSLWI